MGVILEVQARATVPRRNPEHNGRSVLVAGLVALAVVACNRDRLPDPGWAVEHLTRLEGAPVPERDPERLRILVADLGFGLPDAGEPDGSGDGAVDRLERFAEHATAFDPDVVIVFDGPVAGSPFVLRYDGTAPLGVGAHEETVDPAERLAVELEQYHRIETVVRSGRLADRHDRVAGGPLLFSEWQPTEVAHTDVTGATIGRYETPASTTRAVLVAGPTLRVPVVVRDGGATPSVVGGIEIVRQTPCPSPMANAAGTLCVVVPDDWSVLRWSGESDLGGTAHGGAIRFEVRPAPLGPEPTPEGSAAQPPSLAPAGGTQ